MSTLQQAPVVLIIVAGGNISHSNFNWLVLFFGFFFYENESSAGWTNSAKLFARPTPYRFLPPPAAPFLRIFSNSTVLAGEIASVEWPVNIQIRRHTFNIFNLYITLLKNFYSKEYLYIKFISYCYFYFIFIFFT